MPSRNVIRLVHLVAGVVGLLMILSFWSATVASELIGDRAAIVAVKNGVLWGMIVLVPAMAAVGGTGFYLGGRSAAPVVATKRRRMPVIALNGLLVLVPSAFFLAERANTGEFDTAFALVQAIELVAGAANIALMGLNMRDGLRLTAKRRRRYAPPGPAGHEPAA